MSGLRPVSDAGARLVSLAEEHAASAWERAAEHDRDGSFPVATFAEMRASGFLAAFVPIEHGGLGVSSVSDWVAAVNRLGRGDGSTAIAANMHLGSTFALRRGYDAARRAGLNTVADKVGVQLEAARTQLLCAPHTERGTALHQPRLSATSCEGGWALNGRKLFATMSPVATAVVVTARVEGDPARTAIATVRVDTPGLVIEPSWDAMGMRASGSHEVVFTNCRVATEAVLVGGEWGQLGADTKVTVVAQVSALLAAFVGIAERARDLAIEAAKTTRRGPSGLTLADREGVRRIAADIEVSMHTARGMLESTVSAADRYLAAHGMLQHDRDELNALFEQFLATKLVVNRCCIDAVDSAMTLAGGSSYLTSNPLSRLYRDVRAGPPMQPSPVECWSYLGHAAVGRDADPLLA